MTSSNSVRDTLFEDAAGMAGAQLFAVVVSGLAGVAWGIAHVGAVGVDGYPIQMPFSGLLAIGLVVAAPVLSIAPVSRYTLYWMQPNQRSWIATRLGQMLIMAAAMGLVSFALAGGTVDLFTPGQGMMMWGVYSIMISCAVQAVIAAFAMVLLRLGIGLPDALDN